MSFSLRNIINKIIRESVDVADVDDAINNKYYVRIKYDDGGDNSKGNPKGSRVIRPDVDGLTKANHPVLRAFQIDKNSRRGAPNWKFFDLDKIVSWKPMKNKHFYDIPRDDYGKYNLNGDRLMKVVWNKVQYDHDKNDTLNQIRSKRKAKAPKISTKNVQGPIDIERQWGRNVFTSQPHSKIYKNAANDIKKRSKDIEDGLFDTEKWLQDYKAAEQEREIQNQSAQPPSSNSGPIPNKNNEYNKEPEYDEDEIDLEDWLNNNRSNNFLR